MTMTDEHISQTENLLDDGKFKIKLQSELYNLFVTPDNIKSNIDIGNAVMQDFTLSNANKGTNSELYNLTLGQNIAYGLSILRSLDATVNVSDLRYHANKEYIADYESLEPTQEQPGSLGDMQGLPHPFFPGISGWCCDPLNSSLSVANFALGNTLITVGQSMITPALVNARRKLCTKETLEDPRFHGLLYPETFKPEIMEMESNKFRVIPFDIASQAWAMNIVAAGAAAVGNTCYPMIDLTQTGFRKPFLSNNSMTLDEINNMEYNPFSVKKRGAIYKYATFVFKKTLASYNFTYEKASKGAATLGYFKPITGTTTDLYDMVLGDGIYHVPTAIRNWRDALNDGIDPMAMFWYCDGPNRVFTVNTVNAGGDITAFVANVTYSEPAGQSLNISMKFSLTSPVMSPVLSDEVTRCFSGVSQGVLDLTQIGNLSKLFKIIGGSGNTIDGFKVIPSANSNGTLSVTFDNQKITLRSYKLEGLQPYVKKQLAIPYMKSSITQNDMGTVVTTPSAAAYLPYRTFRSVKVVTTVMPIGSSIPRYLLIYCDTPLAYKIKGFSVNFQGEGNSQLLHMSTLMNATKRNGLDFKDFDEDGYPIINNCTHNAARSVTYKAMENATPVGSFLLLKFGSDITLPYGMYPGMTGVVCNLQYEFDVEFQEEYVTPTDVRFSEGSAFNGVLYVDHISEVDYIISANDADNKTTLISPPDATSALQKVIARIEGNHYTSSRSRMYSGGSFISDAFRKVRNAGAKLVSPVTGAFKAYNMAHKFLDDNKGKVGALQKGFNGLTRFMVD